MLTVADYQSPIGILHAEFDDDVLCTLLPADTAEPTPPDKPAAIALSHALDRYFAGDAHAFDGTAIRMQGTPFQIKVWNALRRISYGQVRTYGEIAIQIGQPGASRAVGGACSKNRLLLIVPCHRVVSSGGGLGGFALGADIKRQLLRLESATIG